MNIDAGLQAHHGTTRGWGSAVSADSSGSLGKSGEAVLGPFKFTAKKRKRILLYQSTKREMFPSEKGEGLQLQLGQELKSHPSGQLQTPNPAARVKKFPSDPGNE